MLVSKTFVVFFFLCFVHNCVSKPATGNEVTEGRGIETTQVPITDRLSIGEWIWSWITYPLSWFWSSGETEQPVAGQLLGSTTNNPNDVVDISGHKVTIWCNDQTCNTMKCDKTQCRNVTCNIYDTNFKGECREYNITTDSDELTVRKTTQTTPKEIIPSKPTEVYNVTSLANNTQENDNNSAVEEHPLQLEAALSSTVNKLKLETHSGSKEDPTIYKTQVK